MTGSKGRIITVVCLLLSLCTVTFAWFFDTSVHESLHIDIDYLDEHGHRLYLGDSQLKVEIYVYDEATDTYTLTTEPITADGIVPNTMIRFRIRIINKSAMPQTVSLYATNVTCSPAPVEEGDPDLAVNMFISMAGGSGYNIDRKTDITYPDDWFSNVTEPDSLFVCIGDTPLSDSGSRTVPICPALIVPVTGESRYVELDCAFWFDRKADRSYQDMTFSVGGLLLVL